MRKSVLLGTILGGLAAFLWSTISWELLSWHEKPLLRFQDEDRVAGAISSQTTRSGTYILPAGPLQADMTADQKKAAQAVLMEKMMKGPIMIAAVRRDGFGSVTRAFVVQFLSLTAAAFLLTWLLLQTRGLGYARRVAFLTVVGLAAGVISDLPNWNWWGFSGSYTAVNLADFTLNWLFAGLVIAWVANPKEQ